MCSNPDAYTFGIVEFRRLPKMNFWKRPAAAGFDRASDQDLIDGLVEGDQAAFTAFYERYSRLIYHLISRLESDIGDDIFQEFFVKLQETRFRALQQWRRSRPFPNFLRRIVRNFALDRLRSETMRRRAIELDDVSLDDVDSGEVSVQEAIEMREMRKGAIRAWSELPSERDRRIICGKYFRDIPSALAAERERLAPGAYRKALFDAQRRFMTLVKRSLPDYFS